MPKKVPSSSATIIEPKNLREKRLENETFKCELEHLDAEILLREANIVGLKVEIKNFHLRKKMIQGEIEDRGGK